MNPYDFILAGGGLAGLSLAYRLINSPLRDRSLLIIDPDAKTRNDRTWCFWTNQPTLFDRLAFREWDRIHFAGDKFERDIDLGNYRYKMVRGIDFYRFARQELTNSGNVEFRQGTVEAIDEGKDYAHVLVDGHKYAGRWVFDSRFSSNEFKLCSAGAHYLPQHFKGWEIKTQRPAFRPEVPTLIDLRTPQKNALRFFYVLPFSEQHALVEYVTLGRDRYDEALQTYTQAVLGIRDYEIVASEGGVNPLTDYVFTRRASGRVMNIGTRGGRIKPSTGYAFLRIQQDSAAIVQSLLANGSPFDVPADSRRYRLYDTLMLYVMQHHGEQTKPIFTALFKNNPITRVFRFLDEQASPAENSLLIASLPPGLFLQALFQLKRNAL